MLELQRALVTCSKLEKAVGMQWALSKGKSEVLLQRHVADMHPSFPFANGAIETVTESKYLGVRTISQGISPEDI